MNATPEVINYKEYPILYIDDLQDNLKNFKNNFEKDFTIFLTESAAQALELLKKENITVVLADQRMPEMTGAEFLKIIKDKYPQIVRILITAYSDLEAVENAVNEGKIFGYIRKPIEKEEIRTRIQDGIQFYYIAKEKEEKERISRERDQLYQEKVDAMKKLARAKMLNVEIKAVAGFADRIGNYFQAVKTLFDIFPPKKMEELRNNLDNMIKLMEEMPSSQYSISSSGLSKMLKLREEIERSFKPTKYNFQKEESKVIIDIVNEAEETLRPDMENKTIKINKELSGNPPVVYIDRDKIKEVLYHLLRNSIHAIPETIEGSVLVKITGPIHKSGREFLRIIVQDNGAGIPEKDKEEIFDAFFTSKGTAGGYGLGLVICQSIIAQHEGEIELDDTEVGKGTTFHIDLPVKNEPPVVLQDWREIQKQFPGRQM